MLALLALILVAVFIGIGFVRNPWLKVPGLLLGLWVAAYVGLQTGTQLERTRFISSFLAPLAQFGRHMDDIKDDSDLFRSKFTRWNEVLQKSNYQIDPVTDEMFKLINEQKK